MLPLVSILTFYFICVVCLVKFQCYNTVITAVVVPAAVSPVEAGWLVAVRQRGPLLASEWLQGAFSDVWDLGANV